MTATRILQAIAVLFLAALVVYQHFIIGKLRADFDVAVATAEQWRQIAEASQFRTRDDIGICIDARPNGRFFVWRP